MEKGLSKQPQATREGKGSPLIILPHNYCHYCPRCNPFIFFLKIALRPLMFDPTLELVLQNCAPRDTVCVSGSPTSGWFSGFLANCWQRHFPPPLRWKLSPSPETPSPETWPCPVFHSEQISFFLKTYLFIEVLFRFKENLLNVDISWKKVQLLSFSIGKNILNQIFTFANHFCKFRQNKVNHSYQLVQFSICSIWSLVD